MAVDNVDEFIDKWGKSIASLEWFGTHWDGCHLQHATCALVFAIDEIVRLRAVLDAIDAQHFPLQSMGTRRECAADGDDWPCPTHLLIHPDVSA